MKPPPKLSAAILSRFSKDFTGERQSSGCRSQFNERIGDLALSTTGVMPT
ncbi:hypothetical protein [Granulicella sp. S156]|nr:hypothetical protein [Granulicella sp. S156]